MKESLEAISTRTLAMYAGVFSGVVFGIYWIPLRVMEEAGFPGVWSVMLFNAVAFILILPYVLVRWRDLIPGRLRLHLGAAMAALAYVLYTGAFLYTEVIRVLVLFYLMPIWGFVLARLITGEKITTIRWVCMALGLSGLVVICGVEQGIPVPSNAGDWMALVSGIMWAGVALSLLTDKKEPVNYTIGFMFWAWLLSVVIALVLTRNGLLRGPEWGELSEILVWLIPFAVLVIIPGAFATMFGPSQLNPGVVGLLFMTEISVGTTTAALFAGEPFGAKEITGVILITLAGVSEPLYRLFSKPQAQTTRMS